MLNVDYGSPLAIKAREVFVNIVKEENFFNHGPKQSIRQHWNGPLSGFHDSNLQKRWMEFKRGFLEGILSISDVYLISEHEYADSVGFASDFKTEAYLDYELADKRFEQLKRDNPKQSGSYFLLSSLKLNEGFKSTFIKEG